MNENLAIWDKLKTPPSDAMTKIKGGRLNGMTDIKPQWRYMAMTEQFGPIGIGWGYNILALWTEKCDDGTVCAFSKVAVWYKVDSVKSELFDGIGGSMLVAKESAGLRTSDECYKMATTDALSVALKMIGVGSDVYSGKVSHDSKYAASEPEPAYVHKHEDSGPEQKKIFDAVLASLRNADTMEEIDRVAKKAEAIWNKWPSAWISAINAEVTKREKAVQ